MKIRILQSTASAIPEVPFQAGQILEVPSLTLELRALLDTDRAEIVREEPQVETAMTESEKPTTRAKRTRAIRV